MGKTMKEQLFRHIKKKYKASPEYLWRRFPEYAVFRHAEEGNNKWFALFAVVEKEKLGLAGGGFVPMLNLKIDDMFFRDMLFQEAGIMPAYHMNKQRWITVLLDGSVAENKVYELLDMSYMATASKKLKQKMRPPKEWIIPSNPKYYDIVHAFDDTDEIDWKQGKGIKTGDTVFMYVGAPVSAILYKCRVTDMDIPYSYQNGDLTITSLMKIKLQKRYKPDKFTFEVLKRDHGIHAVRGPRGIPDSLSIALKKR